MLALIPLSMVLRRVKAGYDLASRRGLLNHLLFMVDLKLYGKNEKQVDTLINTVRVFSSDIAMELGISKYECLKRNRKKWKNIKTSKEKLGRSGTVKEYKNQGSNLGPLLFL